MSNRLLGDLNWVKVNEEKLAHVAVLGRGTYEFYCGRQPDMIHDKLIASKGDCLNRCWRCIEAYEQSHS